MKDSKEVRVENEDVLDAECLSVY